MIASPSFLNHFLSTFDWAIPAHVQARPAELRAARHLALLAALAAVSVPMLTIMYHWLGYDAASTMVLTAGIVMMIAPFESVQDLQHFAVAHIHAETVTEFICLAAKCSRRFNSWGHLASSAGDCRLPAEHLDPISLQNLSSGSAASQC